MTLSRALSSPFVLLIRVYQRLISPLLPPTCRYYPSCSAYAVTSLQRFGPLKGLYLTGHRLIRCNPWSRGGVDFVPDTWAERGSPELTVPRLGDDEPTDGSPTDHPRPEGAPRQRRTTS